MNPTYAARLTALLGLAGDSPARRADKLRSQVQRLNADLAAVTIERDEVGTAAADAAASGRTIDGTAFAAIDGRETAMRVALAGITDLLKQAEIDAHAAALAKLDADLAAIRRTTAEDRAIAAGVIAVGLQLLGATGGGRLDLDRIADTATWPTSDPLAALRLRAAALGRTEYMPLVTEREVRASDADAVEATAAARKAISKIHGVAALLNRAEEVAGQMVDAQAAADAAAAARREAAEADRIDFVNRLRAELTRLSSTSATAAVLDEHLAQHVRDAIHFGLERLGERGLPRGTMQWFHLFNSQMAHHMPNWLQPGAANIHRLRKALGMPEQAPA